MSFLSKWKLEGRTLVRSRSQPDRTVLLEHNQQLRREPDALLDMSFMGLELNIPELDFYLLRERFPELNAPDAETRTKAWRRFFASSDADPYRVRDRRRARAHRPTSRRRTTMEVH